MSDRPSTWTLVGIFVPIVALSVCLFLTWSALRSVQADVATLHRKQEVTTAMLEGFAKGIYNIEDILRRIEEQGK